MKIFPAGFEIALILLLLVFFVFGWLIKIDAENLRETNYRLLYLNTTLQDSVDSLNEEIEILKTGANTK